MKFCLVLIGVAALLAGAGAAAAKVISQQIAITVEDFTPYFGSTPIDPLEATFTITYDPAVETLPTADGIKVDSANFPTLTPKFTYLPVSDFLVIGTKPTVGAGFLTNQNGDYGFALGLDPASLAVAQYIALDGSGEYYSNTGTVTVTTVPEPAAWALWIAGAALTGAALRRRRGAGRVRPAPM